MLETRDGCCASGGAVRLTEEPLLSWKRPGTTIEGHGLVLAEIRVRNCKLNAPVSLAVRRSARASEQPYLFAGETPAGSTTWTAWTEGGAMVGVLTVVDTSAARFRAAPRYVAEVIGPRFLKESSGASGLAVGTVVLRDPRPDHIEVGVLWSDDMKLAVLRNSMTAPDRIGKTLSWRVSWMGIEG